MARPALPVASLVSGNQVKCKENKKSIRKRRENVRETRKSTRTARKCVKKCVRIAG